MKKHSIDLSLLDVTSQSVLNSNCTYDTIVYQDASDKYVIESTGYSQNTLRTVTGTFRLKGLFDQAILAQNRISLMPGTTVKGINSSDIFDTDLDVTLGTVSTQSDSIPIGPGTVINGDVFVGVGGDPSTGIGSGGTITGDQYALTEPIVFPEITPPLYTTTKPTLSVIGLIHTLTPADNGRYEKIIIGSSKGFDGILSITSGTVVLHVLGDFSVGGKCQLIIDKGASLVLYLDAGFYSGSGAEINNYNTNPKSLQIFGMGTGNQTLQFKPNSATFALVYAPNRPIEIYPSATLKGAIVGYDVQTKSGSEFIYDKAVQEVSIYEPGVQLVLNRWSE
jgi:hypothetical protein